LPITIYLSIAEENVDSLLREVLSLSEGSATEKSGECAV
jgi:hypothetical protein